VSQRGASLAALHDASSGWWVRLDRSGALTRVGSDQPHLALVRREGEPGDPPLLAAGPRAETFLYTDDSGALELRDVETLATRERWRVRCHSAPWRGLASAASVVVAGDEDAGLYVFWPEQGRRAHIQTHAKHLQAVALDAGGTMMAAALEGRGRALRVAVWGLEPLRVHIFGLDRRALPESARAATHVQVALAWDSAGERLAVLERTRGMEEEGVRAVVAVYDGPSARLLWTAQVDDELVGPGGGGGEEVGALAWDGWVLWVGTCAGELVALDGRDGALREVRWVGSSQPVVQLLMPRPGEPWALTGSGFLGPVGSGAGL
jgi:hypothetical protein